MKRTTVCDAELPFPPTVNRLWGYRRNARYLLPDQERYRELAPLWLPTRDATPGERYYVRLVFHARDRRRRDIDNLVKPVLDVLEHGGVIHDDSQVDRIDVRRGRVRSEARCAVRVDVIK